MELQDCKAGPMTGGKKVHFGIGAHVDLFRCKKDQLTGDYSREIKFDVVSI